MRDSRSRQSAEFISREKCVEYILDRLVRHDSADYTLQTIRSINTGADDLDQFSIGAEGLGKIEDGKILEIYHTIKIHEAGVRRASHHSTEPFLFFNQPSAEADFDYWLDVEIWTADEAAALSMGKEPSLVNAESMRGPLRSSDVRLTFRNRCDVISSAIAAKLLLEPIKPKMFIEWAISKRWDVAEQLANFAKKPTYDCLQNRILELENNNKKLKSDVRSLSKQSIEEIDPRSKRSYLKIILGMAIARYEHKVDRNSQAGSHIAMDLSDLKYDDISVSAETISKILRFAAEELDINSHFISTPKWHPIRK